LKFKTIFVIFNILLISSFLFILCMPFFILGRGYVKTFWAANWYLAAFFLLGFLTVNAYFLLNRKLFSSLERENWPEVREYLENRVYVRNKTSRRTLNILINTYIVLSDIAGLKKLSRHLEEKKSRHFPFFGLELGIPYFTENNAAGRLAYFEGLLENPNVRRRDWIRWALAFSRMAAGQRERAKDDLAALARETKDPVLLLLAVYLLDSCGETSAESLAAETRTALRAKYPPAAWRGLVERSQTNLMVLVLSRLLDEAENWLFGPDTDARNIQLMLPGDRN
jgi:hypothetical protein